jgi:hypothetical protein
LNPAPDLLGDDPDVALALVLLLFLDLLHRQVLPLLPVYGAALALEDLRALKTKGVVLLNREAEFRKIRFFPFFQSMEQPLHLKISGPSTQRGRPPKQGSRVWKNKVLALLPVYRAALALKSGPSNPKGSSS